MPRTYTVYVETGERYPNGRKKYKQVRRVIKSEKPKAISPGKTTVSLESIYSQVIKAKQSNNQYFTLNRD